LFVKNGLEIMVAQSYSKNLGLYGERVGALNVVLNDANVSFGNSRQCWHSAAAMFSTHAFACAPVWLAMCKTHWWLVVSTVCLCCCCWQAAKAVLSQLKRLARALWSNPPTHGARIAAEVVGDASMFEQWKGEVSHGQSNASWHLHTTCNSSTGQIALF
jgi:aspartate aminotransferase